MNLELKKDLEASLLAVSPSFIDAPAVRGNGKIFFRNRELHDFSCFDVLGLSQDRSVKRQAQESIELGGVGNCGSRKSGGTSTFHLSAEKALSDFFGYERSLLFSSRNQAVFSLLANILREQDRVYCDVDYAGLLSDVCLLLNCDLEVLDLNNSKELESRLLKCSPHRRQLVVADSVSFSSGRKLELVKLSVVCNKHQALLVLDESSAVGIIGERGAGLIDEADFGLSPTRPFCILSDLGFGLGVYGACISGPAILIDALAARSKTLGSEPSFPSALAAALAASLDACQSAIAKRALLKAKREFILASLLKNKQGLKVLSSSFVSVNFTKWKDASSFAEFLISKGYFVELLPSPSSLSSAAFVRVIPSSFHSDSIIVDFLSTCSEFFENIKD